MTLVGLCVVLAFCFVGGLVGSLLIGFLANPDFFGGEFKEGLFYGGGLSLLGEQILANAAAIVWSFVLTFVIVKVLQLTIGISMVLKTFPLRLTTAHTAGAALLLLATLALVRRVSVR